MMQPYVFEITPTSTSYADEKYLAIVLVMRQMRFEFVLVVQISCNALESIL